MEIKLIPTAAAIKGPSPCHHAKGNTTSIIKTPNKAPVIASLITALIAPRDFNFCVLKPLITTVELCAPTFPPVPISNGIKAANKTISFKI